jgi:protocatechuate 3,4-dioxygenase beta subunit
MKSTLLRVSLLVSIALAASAQIPPAPAAPAGQTADEKVKLQAKLQGQVLNQVTGEPVRKANLSLKPESGGTTLKAVTDNEGKFNIENIDPGTYTLAAERQGFVTQNYGARRPSGPGTTLELKSSQTLKDLSFKLTPQGVIAGRVVDDDAEPMSGLSVQVLQYKYLLGKKRLVPAMSTLVLTNDLGEFRAPNLSPGRYYVATSPQKIADIQMGTERSAATKGETEGPIPTYYPNATDATTASPVDVGPGAEVRGIDVRVRKARVFRIAGKLINAATGTPVSPGMLMVFRKQAGGMSTIPVSIYAVQGDKGVFELRNIPPGSYSMLAMSTNPQDMMMMMQSVDVTEQDIEGMIVSLGSGVEIPVTAKLEGVQPPPDQDPNSPDKKTDAALDLSNVRIILNLEENPMASLSTAQIGKDNKALLKKVSIDHYRLIVVGLPRGTYLKSAKYGDRDVLESGIDLRQGAAGSLDLVIAAPAAQLTGAVHNEKGDPVPGAMITLVPKDPKGRTDLSRSGTADQNGNIRMLGIIPAEYNVFAWEDIEQGAADDEDFRKPFDSLGTKVKLSEGSKESIQLTVITRAAVDEAKSRK